MSVLFNGPDRGGYFGVYGGIHVPDILLEPLREISENISALVVRLIYCRVALYSPSFSGSSHTQSYCRRLSDALGGAQITSSAVEDTLAPTS